MRRWVSVLHGRVCGCGRRAKEFIGNSSRTGLGILTQNRMDFSDIHNQYLGSIRQKYH